MKALVYNDVREMNYQAWPDPRPGTDEVLVAVRAVGICGSDLHGYTGASSRRIPPLVIGHEATGEIVGGGDEFSGRRVVTYELTVRGTMNYVDEFDRAIALLSRGLLDRTQLVTHQYPLSEGAAVFHQLANQPGDSIKVVLTNEVEPLR